MQHGDLDKTKVLKTQRDSMSDVRTKFQEYVEICHTSQTGIAHWSDQFDLSKSKSGPSDLSDPFIGLQSRLSDMSDIGLD
jgi:hypothetical protein